MVEWTTPVRTRLIPEEETYSCSTTLLTDSKRLGHVSYMEFANGNVLVLSAAAWMPAETRSLEIPDGCTVDEAKASVEAVLALEDNRE